MRFKHRKNFLPTFLLAILFWSLWGWLVYFHPPANTFLIASFFGLLFLALFLTAGLVFANSQRGFLTSLFAILILIFCYHQLANLLNILLLVGIFLSLELYLDKR